MGRYSGDMQLALALSRSLVAEGRCNAAAVAAEYARCYDPRRGFREYDLRILDALKEGEDYATVARCAQAFLHGPGSRYLHES